MGFSGQQYWSGLPCPPPGDLPDPGANLRLLRLLRWQEGSLLPVLPEKPICVYARVCVRVCTYTHIHLCTSEPCIYLTC